MLGWSINLFRVFGIQLTLHGTFLLLLAYTAYEGWLEGGALGMAWRVLLTVCFFLCVLPHSLQRGREGSYLPRRPKWWE